MKKTRTGVPAAPQAPAVDTTLIPGKELVQSLVLGIDAEGRFHYQLKGVTPFDAARLLFAGMHCLGKASFGNADVSA